MQATGERLSECAYTGSIAMKNLYMMQACDKPDGIISIPYSIGVLYKLIGKV